MTLTVLESQGTLKQKYLNQTVKHVLALRAKLTSVPADAGTDFLILLSTVCLAFLSNSYFFCVSED